MPVHEKMNDAPVLSEEEKLRQQKQTQQEHETSYQKSGKLIPFLNAKAERHQERIDTINGKIATQHDKIEKHTARIEQLSAKADRLSDQNKMLAAAFGSNPLVQKFISANEKRIADIRDDKILNRTQKLVECENKIMKFQAKKSHISHKLDRVVALSDVIKSFSISFNKERREVFADAMDRLKQAVSACLVDKKDDLIAKCNKLGHQYSDPKTSMVDKIAIQKKIDYLNEKINALDDKIDDLDCPDNYFAKQSNYRLDNTMNVTAESIGEAVEMLNNEHYDRSYTPVHHAPKPKRTTPVEISIAENSNSKRVFAYLCKTRGLDYNIVSSLVRCGKIAQEQKTGNVVFKIFDEKDMLVGAEKVGTSTDHRFKGIAENSAEGYGFELVLGNGSNAFFFESSIDLLSFMQMYAPDNCRLVSMMGVKPSVVKEYMNRYSISPENIYLCADNDKAGNSFVQRLKAEFPQMNRIVTENIYKDWNDQLRKIPKTEQKKEVSEMTTYGNKIWNDATDNRDKTLLVMREDAFREIKFNLDSSGINFFAYAKNDSVIMAVNDKDMPWIQQIAGGVQYSTRKSDKPYSPPYKNVIGNAEYRYIPEKQYISADRDTVLKMAEVMQSRGIKFSGRIYPMGKGTLTVSRSAVADTLQIQQSIIDARSMYASYEKGQVIGNTQLRSDNQPYYYHSTLSAEQYREIKPYLETSADYTGVIRNGRIMFSVDKGDAQNFHRALENAQREVGIIHTMQELDLSDERMQALAPVMHRLSAEDVKLQLADFFNSRYDDSQFNEMLSLVNAYLDQPVSEKYGEHSILTKMLESKSNFDRSIELSDFFSRHNFSDEQRAAITAIFVGNVTQTQIEVIDETFTPEDISAYNDVLLTALQESDISDFLHAHEQATLNPVL